MAVEFMDIVRDIGSIATLVLIPIWKGITAVKDELQKTNLKLAENYVTKSDCEKRHEECGRKYDETQKEFRRVYDRIDRGGK